MIKFAKLALLLLLCSTTIAGFLWLKPAAGPFRNQELARMVVFHVPCAIVASVASVVATVYAILYLAKRKESNDVRSKVSFSLALLFWILTTVTGAIFAKVQWGQYWSWDIKQTSILMLLMINIAYFGLRSAIEQPQRRAAAAAAYSIFAMLAVPYLTYIFPNSTENTLHPKQTKFDDHYAIVLWAGAFGMTCVYAWIFRVHVAIEETVLRAARLAAPPPDSPKVTVRVVSRI